MVQSFNSSFCLQVRFSILLLSAVRSPCSRQERSARSMTLCWPHLVTCTRPGGQGWTAVTTAGCPMAASATLSPSPGLSAEGACWGCAHSTSMKTKPVTQTLLKDLESSASKVRLKHTLMQFCHQFPTLVVFMQTAFLPTHKNVCKVIVHTLKKIINILLFFAHQKLKFVKVLKENPNDRLP